MNFIPALVTMIKNQLFGAVAILGAVSATLLGLWNFHKYEVRKAVDVALTGMVSQIELDAANFRYERLEQRLQSEKDANTRLLAQFEEDQNNDALHDQAIRDYIEANPVSADGCSVDGDIIDLLRGQ